MLFYVCDYIHCTSPESVCLVRDKWDDYGFKTMLNMYYYDAYNTKHNIGPVSIAVEGMTCGWIIDHLPKEFTGLGENFFSLGRNESYYENLTKLGDSKRDEILSALHDVAFDLDLFHIHKHEHAMQSSLMRDTTDFTVKYQLSRMAHGGDRLTEYHFAYSLNPNCVFDNFQNTIDFDVKPNSNPPTNIHVLIGRNGTGKTTLIKNMIHSIRNNDHSHGSFEYTYDSATNESSKFANILCVAFSPFDDFSELELIDSAVPYSYIGLDKKCTDLLRMLEEQFLEEFSNCVFSTRKRRLWLEAVETLGSDPAFAENKVSSLVDSIPSYMIDESPEHRYQAVKELFSKLSSGHKVVLLIITSCVNRIEEKSIVFMDEPENHLHPPLLSALIRALSNLLIERNGVAIISTHSPVVLQEVPSSCVWSVRRCGGKPVFERLPLRTFGASLGQLTNEVFGLEVTESGFHKLLENAVQDGAQYHWNYMWIVAKFGDQLGDEAKLHLRTLLALHDKKDDT